MAQIDLMENFGTRKINFVHRETNEKLSFYRKINAWSNKLTPPVSKY